MTRRATSIALALALATTLLFGCNSRDSARLKQANEALTADVRRLEHEAADLRDRLERARNAVDLAQDRIDAARSELEQLPDDVADAADAAASKLEEATDALDDAADATDGADGADGADLNAPVMV